MAKYARMPLIGNVLNVFGIGPTQIAGSLVGLDRHPVLIFRGWQLITAAGVAASVPLFSAVFRATGVARRPSTCSSAAAAALLTAVVAALYILPIATLQAGYWFDRYLLPVLPLLMVLISIGANRSMVSRSIAVGPVVGAALLAFYGVVAVSMTHDYLAWNRTRWQALELLLQETGSPREYVDGGFEFNGWFFGSSIEECNPQRARARHTSDRSWGDFTCIWDRRSAQYFVSPVVGAGNRVEQSHSFTRWFPPGKQQLYVLRRNLDQ